MDWICPKHQALKFRQNLYYFAVFFFFSITLVPCCILDACFGILLFCIFVFFFSPLSFRSLLWSNYRVVDPSPVLPSQQLNSEAVLKTPSASWWHPWAVTFLSRVCKDVIKAKGGYFVESQIYFDLFNTFLVTTWFHMCYFIVLMSSLLFYNVGNSTN